MILSRLSATGLFSEEAQWALSSWQAPTNLDGAGRTETVVGNADSEHGYTIEF
jgi:hypothetical protein